MEETSLALCESTTVAPDAARPKETDHLAPNIRQESGQSLIAFVRNVRMANKNTNLFFSFFPFLSDAGQFTCIVCQSVFPTHRLLQRHRERANHFGYVRSDRPHPTLFKLDISGLFPRLTVRIVFFCCYLSTLSALAESSRVGGWFLSPLQLVDVVFYDVRPIFFILLFLGVKAGRSLNCGRLYHPVYSFGPFLSGD